MSDAAVDGVTEAGLGLVTDGDDGVEALVVGDVVEELGDVTCSEHFVDRREMRRPLLRVEVRSEYAPRHALPPQELARSARSSSSSAAATATTAAARVCAHFLSCICLSSIDLDSEMDQNTCVY